MTRSARAVTKLDLEIPQGGTYRFVVTMSGGPDDLTGYTGWMQIRDTKVSTEVLAEYTSEIVVNPLTSQVVVEIPDTETAGYAWDNGVYDLVIQGPEGDWRVVEGIVQVNHSVTRED